MSSPTTSPQSVLNSIYFLQFQQNIRDLLSTPPPPTVLIFELVAINKNHPGWQCQNMPRCPFKGTYYNVETHESTCCLGGCETQESPPKVPIDTKKEAKKQRALKRKAILAAGGGVRCECCQKGFQTENHFYTKHVAKCGK
jgi:hypothetical protein